MNLHCLLSLYWKNIEHRDSAESNIFIDFCGSQQWLHNAYQNSRLRNRWMWTLICNGLVLEQGNIWLCECNIECNFFKLNVAEVWNIILIKWRKISMNIFSYRQAVVFYNFAVWIYVVAILYCPSTSISISQPVIKPALI